MKMVVGFWEMIPLNNVLINQWSRIQEQSIRIMRTKVKEEQVEK